MKVDLQQMKTEIERELQQVEMRRSLLLQQITDIEAVQWIANGITTPGGTDRVNPDQGEQEAEVAAAGRAGKTWFWR